jgi:hypothetical protein
MAIDTTIGGENAQSFCDEATAYEYFSGRLFTDVWDAADLVDKEKALIWATRALNTYEWRGTRVTTIQALSWPRNGVYTSEVVEIRNDIIPDFVIFATCEMALHLLSSGNTNNELDGLTSLDIGPLKMSFQGQTKNNRKIPTSVNQYISDYIFDYGNNVRIVRA